MPLQSDHGERYDQFRRLSRRFIELAEIDSESRHEAKVAAVIEKTVTDMGVTVCYDRAGEKTGGDCSNLVARFPGNRNVPPLFLSGHMDTVVPGKGGESAVQKRDFHQ